MVQKWARETLLEGSLRERRARCREAYEAGAYGLHLRSVFFDRTPLFDAHEMLARLGFGHFRFPLFAERTANNEPTFRTRSGETTRDPNARDVVPVDVYLHPDHSMVQIFSLGDPTGRRAPRNTPTAIKAFALTVPARGSPIAAEHTRFTNVAFRITCAGDAIAEDAYLAMRDGLRASFFALSS